MATRTSSKASKKSQSNKNIQDFYKSTDCSQSPSRSPKSDLAGVQDPLETEEPQSTPMIIADSSLKKIKLMLQEEIHSAVKDLRKDIHALNQRTQFLEENLDQLADSHEHCRIETEQNSNQIKEMQAKIEDLENRSRRNNIRIRGVPNKVTDLMPYAKGLLHSLLPMTDESDWAIERLHRAVGSAKDPNLPKDIILRFVLQRTRDTVLMETRKKQDLTGPDGSKIQIYMDLAPSTLQKRREMRPALCVLQQHKIIYRWGFPFALTFQLGGKTYRVQNLDECMELLARLKLMVPDNTKTGSPERNTGISKHLGINATTSETRETGQGPSTSN